MSGSALSPARRVAAESLVEAARRFPDLAATAPAREGLAPADRALALSIQRTTLQRWLTLRWLLNRHVRGGFDRLEPRVQAVLLTGAAQVLLMPGIPAHAACHQSVGVARALGAGRAAGMVNAVLRRLCRDVRGREAIPWQPHPARLPAPRGVVHLGGGWLPPLKLFREHLEVAASIPRGLLADWEAAFGAKTMVRLARGALGVPPTVVAVEPGLDPAEAAALEPHREPGFAVWTGPRESLAAWLEAHPARRVQDVGASRAIRACAALAPGRVVDYCAGRGTKTAQMLAAWPGARVLAAETHAGRRRDLETAFAAHPRVAIGGGAEALAWARGDGGAEAGVDLVLVDVPCSNTGVLARRPEARYRYGAAALDSLRRLQRQIVEAALELLAPGGHLLYSTCSIEPRENEAQRSWMEAAHGLSRVGEAGWLPGGEGASWEDGGYFALMRKPASPSG